MSKILIAADGKGTSPIDSANQPLSFDLAKKLFDKATYSDEFIFNDGLYNFIEPIIIRGSGKQGTPLRFSSRSKGGAVFKGLGKNTPFQLANGEHQNGFVLRSGSWVEIDGLEICDIPYNAFDVASPNTHIVNCIVSRCGHAVKGRFGGTGILAGPLAEGSIFEENYIEHTREHIVYISNGASKCVVKNNICMFACDADELGCAIQVNGEGTLNGCLDNKIIGNTIIGATSRAILVLFGPNTEISGNICHNNKGPGIQLSMGSSKSKVVSNHIISDKSAFYISKDNKVTSDVELTGNILYNTDSHYTPITVELAQNFKSEHNIIKSASKYVALVEGKPLDKSAWQIAGYDRSSDFGLV